MSPEEELFNAIEIENKRHEKVLKKINRDYTIMMITIIILTLIIFLAVFVLKI
jgi:type IV secretory pathway component VirB8